MSLRADSRARALQGVRVFSYSLDMRHFLIGLVVVAGVASAAAPEGEARNAAVLYMEALGVAENEPLIDWYRREGEEVDDIHTWLLRGFLYVDWLGEQNHPSWAEFEEWGLHPRGYEEWLKHHKELFADISNASLVEEIDDSVFVYEDPRHADLPARVLARVAKTMFAASLAHARAGEMEEANARYVDGLRVMRHSFHTNRALITAAMTIHPLFYVEMIATMPNEHFPGMEAYLDEETRREALEILGSLDEEDPFEYRRAVLYEVDFVVEWLEPDPRCEALYRAWMFRGMQMWTQPDALERLEKHDADYPKCAHQFVPSLARERKNDADKREMLRRTMEALAAGGDEANAAVLYMEALGVPEGMAIDEWHQTAEAADMSERIRNGLTYYNWLKDPEHAWDEWAQEMGVHPADFPEWVEENRGFYEAIARAARAERMSVDSLRFANPEHKYTTNRWLADIAICLLCTAQYAEQGGDMQWARELTLDAMRVLVHSAQCEKTLVEIGWTVRIADVFREFIQLPAFKRILDAHTSAETLSILERLDADDPYGYIVALPRHTEMMIEHIAKKLGILGIDMDCAERYRTITAQAMVIWNNPDAEELLEKLDDPAGVCQLQWWDGLDSAWRDDQEARGYLTKIREKLQSIADAAD